MRYDRQILLPEIGVEGQEKLRKSKVLIVGMGGLGSPIALYLAGAGVGTLGLIDDDRVSLSNLHRQILYTEAEVGQNKAEAAARHLAARNSEIVLQTYPCRLTIENATEIIAQYDIVIDGCDNFSTRYLIDDTCQALHKVYIYGAIRSLQGMVSVFHHQGPWSYRTLYPHECEMRHMPPPDKAVVGVTPAITGIVQAGEALKIICGYGDVLAGKLWTIDLCTLQSHIIFI